MAQQWTRPESSVKGARISSHLGLGQNRVNKMPLGKFKAVLQQHFPSSFDARLPNHWDIRIRTPKPPFPHLRVFDNPLTIQEELRIEEAPFTDTRFFTFDGRIEPNTPPENPTDKIAFMNIIEDGIPVEVLEETEKILRWKFDGKKLKGTLVVNRQLKQAFFEPGTTREAVVIHGRRMDPARFLEAWQFTDRYDALGILRPEPEDICQGHCEGVGWFPIKWESADAELRLLWVAAEIRRPQDDGWHFVRCPECEGTGLNQEARKKRKKKGRKYEAEVSEQAMVWRVTYRSAVMFFKRKADAEEYAAKFPSARIERVAAPSDVVVRGSEMEEASIGLSGAQPHPHPADEGHAHPGLPFAGAHDHATSFGYHRHRPEDPLDGAHLNMGAGQHDHLLAKGLASYVSWSVEVHLKHPWVPGFVRAWILHVRPGPEEKEFRIAGPSDWHEHTLWHMHSTGRSDPGAHASMFLDPEHRIIIKEYEMEDGTRRPATQGDFDAEEVWFRDNTPPELRQRLMEAGLESQDVPEAVQQPERAAEQATPGFEPAKASDRALQKEWERLLSDQKAMGGTPEDALKGRAAAILKEIVKRGRANVRPRSPAEERLTAAGLKRFISEGVVLPRQSARDLATGKATLALYPRENKCFLTFMLLIDGKKVLGFIRHKAPKKVALVDVGKLRSRTGVGPGTAALRFEGLKTVVAYQVREFIPLPSPIVVENPAAADRIMPRVKLVEAERPHTQSLSNKELVELHAELHIAFGVAKDGTATPYGSDQDVIGAHADVLAELGKRGLEHRPIDDLDHLSIVRPEIKLADVSGRLTGTIYLKRPLMAIVGGTAVSGKGKDLDIWINWDPADESFLRVLMFRVKSMLPPDVDVHFITDAQGPFTTFMPLADLKVDFVPEESRELIAMSLEEAITDEAKREAEATVKEDRIEPFRFYFPPKPQAGVRGAERRRPETLVDRIKPDEFPVFVQPKFDGVNLQLHADGDRIELRKEGGQKVLLDLIPSVVKELLARKKARTMVTAVEAEIIINGKRLGRSEVAGYLNSKTLAPKKDKGFRLTAHDLLFLNGRDLHKLPAEGMIPLLEGLPESRRFRVSETILAKTPKAALAAIARVRKKSEGAVVKSAKGPFWIKGDTSPWWWKFRNEGDLLAQVLERIPIAGTKAAWKYRVVIRGEEGDLVPLGTTFTTALKAEEGDIIRVSFGNINEWTDPKTGMLWFAAVFPRVVEITDEDKPETVEQARAQRKSTSGQVGERPFPKDFTDLLEAVQENEETLEEDIKEGKLVEQAPACMPRAAALRARKPNPETFPKGKWRLSHHHRGASVHKDLRMKVNGFLRGWTIADAPAGAVKEGPESLKQLYDIRDRVKWKFRPDMDPATAVVAVPKARQSLIWLNVVNVIIEPGQVGATKNERGAFTLCDEGMFFEGMDKPLFKEFFFDGNVFKGRVTFRLISTRAFAKRAKDPEETPKRALQWQLKTNLKDQVPTILGTRERRKPKDQQFVPAEGQMLIPPKPVPNVTVNARMIKEEFQWWAKGLRKATRLKRLDLAFNDLIEQGILTARKLEINESALLTPEFRMAARETQRRAMEMMENLAFTRAPRTSEFGGNGIEYVPPEPIDAETAEALFKSSPLMLQEQERNFALIKFFFKGPTVIRGLPFSFWALLFKRDGKMHMIRFEDNVSPLQRDAADKGIAATRKDLTKREAPPGSDDTADWLTFPEDKEIPPAHPLNPNKRIPMFAERVDRGKLQIFTDRDIILTLQAKGADLKGNFVVRRGDPKQDVWTFERGVEPGEKRDTTTKSEQSTFS